MLPGPSLRRTPLPPGYTITQGGETESQQELFMQMVMALGVAILLMYLVLVVQFGSFTAPLAAGCPSSEWRSRRTGSPTGSDRGASG